MVEIDEGRKAEIVAEYNTLMAQNQDRHSVVQALCKKYGLEAETLHQMVAANEGQGVPQQDAPPNDQDDPEAGSKYKPSKGGTTKSK